MCGEEGEELDHIDPTTKTRDCSDIGYWSSRPGTMRERLDLYAHELGKCQPLCTLHHRQKTSRDAPSHSVDIYKQFYRREERRQLAKREKLDQRECFACKKPVTDDNYMGFDWDHRDPATKLANVSSLVYSAKYKLYREMAKCDLLCVKCHKEKTISASPSQPPSPATMTSQHP